MAVYGAIAHTDTPHLDPAMRRLSRAADFSKLNFAAAALLVAAGGQSGRRGAGLGLASLAASSALVNVVLKTLARRARPDREQLAVPLARHVAMPASASLPSGHAASAFAFASGVSRAAPRAAAPIRLLAALVAYSRVHTGVHYPGDVLAGALLGSAVARATTHLVEGR